MIQELGAVVGIVCAKLGPEPFHGVSRSVGIDDRIVYIVDHAEPGVSANPDPVLLRRCVRVIAIDKGQIKRLPFYCCRGAPYKLNRIVLTNVMERGEVVDDIDGDAALQLIEAIEISGHKRECPCVENSNFNITAYLPVAKEYQRLCQLERDLIQAGSRVHVLKVLAIHQAASS